MRKGIPGGRRIRKAGIKRVTRKSTVVLLAFLFILNSVLPAFAYSVRASAQDSSAQNMESIAGSMEPTVNADTENTETKNLQSVSADSANDNLKSAASKSGKTKKDKKENESDLQTESLLSSSLQSDQTAKASKTSDKTNLLKMENLSGALVYEYPINVPQGRNNAQPDLKLIYNSQDKSIDNIFGYGWSINIPYIERINKKGTDKLYTENYFSSSLTGELMNISGSLYGSKVDNGEFLKYEFSNNSWIVADKSGIKYKFGTNAASRQDNSSDTAKVFKWMLEEVRDTNDNFVRYEYFKDSGQIYPYKIFYTGGGTMDGIFEVEFARQARTDAVSNYAAGFLVKTNYRISEVQIKVNGNWARKYAIAYTTGDNTVRSMLYSIIELGRDEIGTITELPATKFEYFKSALGWDLDTTTWTPPIYFRNGRQNMLDLNGDSLVDIVESYFDVETHKGVYINTGNGKWVLNSNLEPPIFFEAREIRSGGYSDVFDQGIRLSDVNGDYYPDIIKGLIDFDGVTFISDAYLNNNGNVWNKNLSWIPAIEFSNRMFASYDNGARILELNGDSLPDIARRYSADGADDRRQFNTGSNFSQIVSMPSFPAPLGAVENQAVDINHDGLTDILSSFYSDNGYTYNAYTYLNKGNGEWIIENNYATPLKFMEGAGQIDQGVRFIDVNGDNLVDAVIDPVNADGGERGTYLNTGVGWLYKPEWNLPIPDFSFIYNTVNITDINSDGLTDFFKVVNDYYGPKAEVYVKTGTAPDLLSKIIYSKGGYANIAYKSSAQYKNAQGENLNPSLPFILQTVKQISTTDGFGNTSTAAYSYEGGKYYYANAFDRKFSGFSKITEIDGVGNVSKTYYHQGGGFDGINLGEYSDHISKLGKPYRIETYDSANNLYSKTINKWENYDLGNGRNFVKLTQKIEQSYDGNASHKDKAETYIYDNANGNLTEKIQWGEVNGLDNGTFTDTGMDKLATTVSYASNIAANILGLPSGEITADQSLAKVKESKYYYDSLALGSVNKGNQTKEEKWVSGSAYINTQKTYNIYGLATSETDPRGKITTYAYDAYNLYPASAVNPLGHITQYLYDYSAGKPKQITDPNGYIFQTTYDGLGRIIEEKQPDLAAPSTLIVKSAYIYTDSGAPTSVKRTDYLDAANAVDSYSYYDGLGKIIQERKEAEDANTFAAKDYVYNNRGLLEKESLPYFSTGSARTSPTTDNSLYNIYAYDSLERITAITNAVGAITNAYDDWKITTTDAKGTPKDLYKDGYDRLVQVGEHNGANIYTTNYTYDGAGNLLKITDALGNIRNFTYDGLGRRLTAEDLHPPSDSTFGVWSYIYDASGNLISQTDPKNQTVNHVYDDLNRVLTEDYTGQIGTEKSCVYDICTNGIGKLCYIASGAMIQNNSYNALGEIASETKTIDSVSYTTQYEYDRLGNETLLTNPDNSKVKYIYNTAGLLDQIQRKENLDAGFSDLITAFNYSPLGKIAYYGFSNGTSTTNTYDAVKLYRLISKITTISGGVRAQDLAYTYDVNGNITRIIDNSQTNSKKTVDYTYDFLNRLTSATSTNAANNQNYTETYTYDAIGNITSKNGIAYYYSSAGKTNPHAVTSIGSTNYAYDDNGNLLTITGTGGLSNTWDYNNRLTQSTIGSTTIDYAYDASGQRIKYSNGSNATVYPSKFYNTDGMTPTRHIFAGDALIATMKGANSSLAVYPVFTDHLTGSNVITNGSGVLEELLDYYPFGDIRLDEKFNSVAADSSGNGNTGILTNMESSDWTQEKSGTALDFDGVNEYVEILNNSSLSFGNGVSDSPFSISSWVYMDNAASFIIFNKGTLNNQGEYLLYTDTFDKLGILLMDNSVVNGYIGRKYNTPLTSYESQWAHIAMTYDGSGSSSGIKLYLNGIRVDDTDFNSGPYLAMESGYYYPTIGRYYSTYSNGKMDEIRIYSRVLTQSEITALYQNPSTINNASLAAHWKFDAFSEQRKYAGQEYDGDTGLSYMNARYYDGKIGRFVSQDSAYLTVGDINQLKQITGLKLEQYLSDPQGFNSYAYARNNPLIYVDEDGRFFGHFGIYVSDAQRSVASSFHNLGNYASQFSPPAAGVAFVSNALGDVSNNVANIWDPRVNAGSRFIAVGLAGLDAGGGKVIKGSGNLINKGINSLVNDKSVFTRAAEHSLDRNHYPGLSLQQIEKIARDTYNNFDIKVNIKDIKQYYYNAKTNDLFINNSKQPTIFQPNRGLQYLKDAVKKDIEKGGRVK